MCTNSARLASTLECYMDDLVDCFEDYVKKSLVIITVAVGALVVMLGYAMKIITDRSQLLMAGPGHMPQRTEVATVGRAVTNRQYDPSQQSVACMPVQRANSNMLPKKSGSNSSISTLKKEARRTSSAAANTCPLSSVPSFDEKVLRNIGLSSCSKGCMHKRPIMRNVSASRIVIPSIPNCFPNLPLIRLFLLNAHHHLSTPRRCSKYITGRKSCCSMCCADDDRK